MLSTQLPSSSIGTSTVRIKSLNTSVTRDEQKDLEEESEDLQSVQLEEPANNDQTQESDAPLEGDLDEAEYSGLSVRAEGIKSFLREQSPVKALCLKSDGSSQEITYSASSSATRSLLSGRPQVVGEIESLQVLVVQCQDQSGSLNKHQLPVPLCHNKTNGDYLLFRVNSEGQAVDMSMTEYESYVSEHKALTASAVKQYSSDSQQIKSNSPFADNSAFSMSQLRAVLETEIADSSKLESETRSAVQQQLQKLVDDMVSSMSCSPMEDQDYSPEDEVEAVTESESEAQSLDERPWREQLQDALSHVQSVGKADGQWFAERVLDTFYELNGTEPALDEISDLFSKIRADFANEAEEELDDSTDSEQDEEEEEVVDFEAEWDGALSVVRHIGRLDGRVLAEGVIDALYEASGVQPSLDDLEEIWNGIQDRFEEEAAEETELSELSESELEMESEEDVESVLEEFEEALDHVRELGRLDGEAMADNLCQIMAEETGQEPSLNELSELWQFIVDSFAAEAEEDLTEVEMDSEDESFEEFEDFDGDYDPNNTEDAVLARWDLEADVKHDKLHFGGETMMNTPIQRSKQGQSWNVYFDEDDLSRQSESSNLKKAMEMFKVRNDRVPTISECKNIAAFLSVPNELCDEEDIQTVSVPITRSRAKVFVSSITETDSAQGFSVYLEDAVGDETMAIQRFEQSSKREPNVKELSLIKAFMATDSDLKEESYVVAQSQPLEFRESQGVGYTLDFDDDDVKEGDEEKAIEWFKKMNKRAPSAEESQQIKQFVNGHGDDTVDID